MGKQISITEFKIPIVDKAGSFGIKPQADQYCRHKYIEVDIDNRVISCRDCEAVIDPFEAIKKFATEETHQMEVYKSLITSINTLRHEQQRLSKQIYNLKEQKRSITGQF